MDSCEEKPGRHFIAKWAWETREFGIVESEDIPNESINYMIKRKRKRRVMCVNHINMDPQSKP